MESNPSHEEKQEARRLAFLARVKRDLEELELEYNPAIQHPSLPSLPLGRDPPLPSTF
jgi:hypothetical protein